MALTIKSLGILTLDLSSTGYKTLLTVPAGTTTIIKTVTGFARGGSAGSAFFAVQRSAATRRIHDEDLMNAGVPALRKMKDEIVLAAGDTLGVEVVTAVTGATAGEFTVSGMEIV